MSAPTFPSVDALLEDLGITEPHELDLRFIAQHCGATIVYKPLEGCAARIAGNEERAIITVDNTSQIERQRFSAGHELGHWTFDRGKVSLFSCEDNLFIQEWSGSNPETRANRYASDLLMPHFMFRPRAVTFRQINFDTVRKLANIFTTSLTATAIRLVEHGPFPSMLVCNNVKEMEWVVFGSGTRGLWPQIPGPDTYAYDILKGRKEEASGDILATSWFEHPVAERYSVHEHSIRAYKGLVLSLLWWQNETMLSNLDDYEEERDARRSDSRRR
ncbi:MAG: ImmA/IrrE family metallo-endopeptidase [Acidobacteria bacterium]|nr:ImmA/IrrE family metallo-endopeptidase [Acidobacteriota bacterium]